MTTETKFGDVLVYVDDDKKTIRIHCNSLPPMTMEKAKTFRLNLNNAIAFGWAEGERLKIDL
jgi:hypothetical protein